jgi:putative sterol carrier protein
MNEILEERLMSDLSIQSLMERMQKAFVPEKAAGYDVTVQVELKGEGGGNWVVAISNQVCTVTEGTIANPTLKMSGSAQTVMDVFTGKQEGVRAYMQGKLRVSGDMSLAMRLTNLFKLS